MIKIKKELEKKWMETLEEQQRLFNLEGDNRAKQWNNLGRLNMLTEIITKIIPEIEKQEEKQLDI